MPSKIGRRHPLVVKHDSAEAQDIPEQHPAVEAEASRPDVPHQQRRPPGSPARSDATLDFTTPQDIGASDYENSVRHRGAQNFHRAILLTEEEHVILDNVPINGSSAGPDLHDPLSISPLLQRQPSWDGDLAEAPCLNRVLLDDSAGLGSGQEGWAADGKKAVPQRQRTVLECLGSNSQAELEAALQAPDGSPVGSIATFSKEVQADVDMVPDTDIKGSPELGSHAYSEPLELISDQPEPDMLQPLHTALSLAGSKRPDFAQAQLQPSVNGALGAQRQPCSSPKEGVLGLPGSPELPWAWAQAPVSVWQAFYEGPDILSEMDEGYQQTSDAGDSAAGPGVIDDAAEVSDAEGCAEDLLSPIHRHPFALALGGRGYEGGGGAARLGNGGHMRPRRPAGKRAAAGLEESCSGIASPVRPQKRPGSARENSPSSAAANFMQLPKSPTLDDAVQGTSRGLLSPRSQAAEFDELLGIDSADAALASPSRQCRGRAGPISVLEELSNDDLEEEAALQKLMTPHKLGKGAQSGAGHHF